MKPASTTATAALGAPRNAASAERLGLWLGLLGVTIFALSLPMTRLAVGSPDAPQMSGVFVALGRAGVAGVLSIA